MVKICAYSVHPLLDTKLLLVPAKLMVTKLEISVWLNLILGAMSVGAQVPGSATQAGNVKDEERS
jgi:hypothetical protein